MIDYLREYFKDWNTWEIFWTLSATVIAIWLGLHWGEGNWGTLLSIVTTITGLWCVVLVAKARIFNYYLGIVNVLGYAYISYQYQLYGEVMLNAGYFLPMQFIGLYIWTKNKSTDIIDTIIINFLTSTQRIFVTIISFVTVIIYAGILKAMGDPLPILDSMSTILSIIAMILMAWRYMEQWILWIIVDIVSIIMWWIMVEANGTRDIAILVMWSAYLVNAIYGQITWINMYREQQYRKKYHA